MPTLTAIFTAYGAESLARSPTCLVHISKLCRLSAHVALVPTATAFLPAKAVDNNPRLSHACGHRHCPQCQHQKARQWLHHQLHQQLPGPYFLITFTVPETLRPFCRSHPRLASQVLCKASSAALTRLARDARFIGTALPGLTGILPTWGQQLQYHPHIHDIVPGGGLSKDRAAWLPSRANFSVPVKALSPVSRAIFQEEMHTAGLVDQIAPQVWHTPWNVHSQANPHGATSLQSLAPYVFKVAISHRRMVSLQDRIVTFTYRTPGSARPRTTQLDVLECMRRFLQHVLPSGVMKVRHFGFLSASCAIHTPDIRRMMAETSDVPPEPRPSQDAPSPPLSCPHCGGELLVITRVLPSQGAFGDTG
jgi:Putative transposase/Transposase zinc-binding domain